MSSQIKKNKWLRSGERGGCTWKAARGFLFPRFGVEKNSWSMSKHVWNTRQIFFSGEWRRVSDKLAVYYDKALFAFNINEYLHFVQTRYLCVSCDCHMTQLVLNFFVMETEGIYCELRTGVLNIRLLKWSTLLVDSRPLHAACLRPHWYRMCVMYAALSSHLTPTTMF